MMALYVLMPHRVLYAESYVRGGVCALVCVVVCGERRSCLPPSQLIAVIKVLIRASFSEMFCIK